MNIPAAKRGGRGQNSRVDVELQRLERAVEADPEDDDACAALARAYLRAGRPRPALSLARALPALQAEREAAARGVAAALGLAWIGVEAGQDRFRAPGETVLVLVPAGAFLDDGPAGEVSSLETRQARADLRRVGVPELLVAVDARLEGDRDAARAAASRLGGRLPTLVEWKKLWRGGLFLDGDATARAPNPAPDRLLPTLERVAEPILAAQVVDGPYGARFDLAACEWTYGDGEKGGVFDRSTWRYHVSLRTPAERRGRRLVWRLVRDLPPA